MSRNPTRVPRKKSTVSPSNKLSSLTRKLHKIESAFRAPLATGAGGASTSPGAVNPAPYASYPCPTMTGGSVLNRVARVGRRRVGRPRGGALSGGVDTGGALSGGRRRRGRPRKHGGMSDYSGSGGLGDYYGSGGRKRSHNPWLSHVRSYWKAHPGMSYGEALMHAKSSYRKGGSGGCMDGGRRRRRRLTA